MNRAANQTAFSIVMSSTAGKVIAACSLIAIVYGVVLADRYLKEWDPTLPESRMETVDSMPIGIVATEMQWLEVPAELYEHKNISADPVADPESGHAEIVQTEADTIVELDRQEFDQREFEIRITSPLMRIDGVLIILLKMQLGRFGNQICL